MRQGCRGGTVGGIDDDGVEREAVAYIANRTGAFTPGREYLALSVRGAREHSLPEEYVSALEQVETHA